jgi:hypothetical protein
MRIDRGDKEMEKREAIQACLLCLGGEMNLR